MNNKCEKCAKWFLQKKKKRLYNCSQARGQIANCLYAYCEFSFTCFLTTSIKSKLQSIRL